MTTENKVEPKADAEGKLDAILAALGAISARVDEMEKNLPAPPLQMAADKKRKDEDDRMDDDDDRKDDDEEDDRKDAKHRKDAKKDDDDEDDRKDDDDRKDAKADLANPEPKKGEGEFEGKAGEMRFDEDEEEDDKEEEEKADAQAKCDSVYALFGKSASRPLVGESVMAYRKRMLRGLQGYSDSYKGVNLASIKDAKLLAIAEKQIFADAAKASKNVAYADGEIEIKRKDASGRTITEFRGSMAWLDAFKMPTHRAVEWFTANNKR